MLFRQTMGIISTYTHSEDKCCYWPLCGNKDDTNKESSKAQVTITKEANTYRRQQALQQNINYLNQNSKQFVDTTEHLLKINRITTNVKGKC